MCASSSINAHIYGIILNTIECDKNRLTISRFRQNSFRFYVLPQSFIPIAVRARMIRLIKLEYNRTRSIRYHESEIQRRSGRASTLATFSYSSADETRGEGGKDDGISSGSEDYLSLSLSPSLDPCERRETCHDYLLLILLIPLADCRGPWKLVGLFRTVALILLSATPESGLSHIDIWETCVCIYTSGQPIHSVTWPHPPCIRIMLIYRVENIPMGGLWVSR